MEDPYAYFLCCLCHLYVFLNDWLIGIIQRAIYIHCFSIGFSFVFLYNTDTNIWHQLDCGITTLKGKKEKLYLFSFFTVFKYPIVYSISCTCIFKYHIYSSFVWVNIYIINAFWIIVKLLHGRVIVVFSKVTMSPFLCCIGLSHEH